MGLADRFKKELNNTDIFKEYKPQQNTRVKREENITKSYSSIPELMQKASLNELKEKTLNKIKQTPYWQDYSSTERENMISKYIDCKTKEIDLGLKEKSEIIRDILAII